jgi:hypothetical protein
MNHASRGPRDRRWPAKLSAAISLVLLTGISAAYPPAPHHTLFGTVRNQWGDPIDVSGAEVFVQTTNGVGVKVGIVPSTQPGVNYQMQVPMDSGTTLLLYQSTALRQSQSFQLKVKIGPITYLPLEMRLITPQIGQPAQATRLDLTLGEDSDGDGLPDAWEQAIISIYGGSLASIDPNGDDDGDGISNRDEYLSGTHAFDPSDGFYLSIVSLLGNSRLEFLAIRGRNYVIEASADLHQWSPVSFRVLSGSTSGPLQGSYFANDVRLLRVEVPFQAGGQTNQYFRAIVR